MTEVDGSPTPTTSVPTVGILGGGQLGRMLALAAIRMGLSVHFLVPKDSSSVDGLGQTTVGDWKDPEVLIPFARSCDVITVESEWAPLEYIEALNIPLPPCWPSSHTLSIIRDKGRQKQCLAGAGLPVPRFACCTTLEEAVAFIETTTFPVLVKRYQGSYDGYGNATVRSMDELHEAWKQLANNQGALVEEWVPFEQELSVLIARRPGGSYVTYPVAYTEQRDHRCHAVEVPASLPAKSQEAAIGISTKAIEAVEGVGILAVELFLTQDGSILINELAPRPHNTGHYSIEANYTSQFENHLRAILDWPLGSPELRTPVAVMVNIIGQHDRPVAIDTIVRALDVDDVSIHIYGKDSSRPKRKMGHVTVTGNQLTEAREKAERAAAMIIL